MFVVSYTTIKKDLILNALKTGQHSFPATAKMYGIQFVQAIKDLLLGNNNKTF